mmetsp:Transcript_2073/g.2342  ORF Transcript_2073/g.2342 Transcript_2073/m.2342 type:complete len:209 (-) Transcript_2073:52-678(-)
MAKILSLTIVLIALIASAHAISVKELMDHRVQTTQIVSIGQEDDLQIFGFSIRGLIFRFARNWLKGYIAGYEGRFTVPGDCLDPDFQAHVSKRGWEAFTTVLTFWRHSKDEIANRIILFLVVVADEVMNDCGDGQVLVDLATLYTKTNSIWKFGLRILVHAIYTAPFLAFWGAFSIVCNLVTFFWGGGYGTGQFINALVVGLPWPWDG